MDVDLRRRLERLSLFQQGLPKGHLCLINRNTENLFSSYSERENDLFEWIGFKGSSGHLCIEENEVRLYVDGRYIQTALRQYGETPIKLVNPGPNRSLLQDLRSWSQEHDSYAVVELDGRKWSAQVVEAMKKDLGGHISWRDRPLLRDEKPRKISSSIDLLAFDEEPAARLKRVQSNLEEGELHVILCTDDISWLFQARSDDYDYRRSMSGVVLLGRQYAALFRDMSQGEVIRLSKERADWRIIGRRDLWKDAVDAVMKKNRDVRIILPYHQRPGSMSWSDYQRLKEDGQDYPLELRDRTVVERGRLNKNSKELGSLTESSISLSKVMGEAMEYCHQLVDGDESISECELRDWIEDRARTEHGAVRLSFPLIVSSGDHTSFPHHQPTDRIIRSGDLVMLDLGFYFGEGCYATDATRCFIAGKDAIINQKMRKVSTLVMIAFLRQWGKVFGVESLKARDLDSLARDFLGESAPQGFEFSHGTGHGLGICDHELGLTIGPSSGITLRENYVYSLEPGLYQQQPEGDSDSDFGVRFEDIVVVEREGDELSHRSLCPMGFDERLIDRSLMDDSDSILLDRYIAAIF